MEVCTMTIKNPPKEKKEICFKRELPYWVPKCNAHTKPQQISVKRKITFTVLAKNPWEAEAKLIRFLSRMGFDVHIHHEEKDYAN